MTDLRTRYMGIELANPIIVGASNLVENLDDLREIEQAGAAAIVYKSLFEEQIQLEAWEMEDGLEEYENRSAEAASLFPDIKHAGPKEHIHKLRKTVEALKIPVFASLNCVYDVSWLDYAEALSDTGVAGLELNFYATPKSFTESGALTEERQVKIVKEIKQRVEIPVAVKLSPYYSNPLNLIKRMDEAGADALVLFNRLFQPEIDTDREQHQFPWNLSHPGDNRLALRFAGLLHGNLKASVAANTGIFTGDDVAQMLLAGADTVQVVSTLYKHKISYLSRMIADLTQWMQAKGYAKIDDFRGKLSQKNSKDPFAYKRAQYVDILMKSSSILETYRLH